jgi:hypothetical protein
LRYHPQGGKMDITGRWKETGQWWTVLLVTTARLKE